MSDHISTQEQTLSVPAVSALGQNLAALAFGALILFAVGFMPMNAVHNAAHDSRHTSAFPCH